MAHPLSPSSLPQGKTRRRTHNPPAIIVIASVLIAAALLLPLIYLVVRATGASGGLLRFVLRPQTVNVLFNTLGLALSVTLAALGIALPVAFLTLRTNVPGRHIWFVLCSLPLVIPTYVGAFVMISAFATGGLLSSWLAISFPSIYGFGGTMLVLTLFSYPYMLLALRAGLRGLDPSLEEASRSLGHSAWGTFFRVSLPHLRPAIAAGSLLVALYVMSDFGAVAMLRYNSFTRAIFVQYQNSFNRSNAAALGLILVLLIALVLAVDYLLRGRRRLERTGSGAARKAALIDLGPWRYVAMLPLLLLVLLALVAPLSVIVAWLWRGIANNVPIAIEWRALWNTVSVSLLAALASTLAAIPIAVLSVRFPSRLSVLLERLSYVGYALPGVVVALTLVFFGARYVPWIYQTRTLLVIGYVILFIPQAVGNIRARLLQISPSLEESARSLGRTPTRVLLEVTFPLLRSGLLTGAALVFLTTMKELPATLLLGPTGFHTLATRIWMWTSEAFYAQAAPSALLLVLASSLSVGLILWQERD